MEDTGSYEALSAGQEPSGEVCQRVNHALSRATHAMTCEEQSQEEDTHVEDRLLEFLPPVG